MTETSRLARRTTVAAVATVVGLALVGVGIWTQRQRVSMQAKSGKQGLAALLRAGATIQVASEHPDAVDEYLFRVVADGGGELDCVPAGPHGNRDAFRAIFTPEALARGDALLAVTQHSPHERMGDLEYHGDEQPRAYTFRKTTPPFLLSDALAARVRERQPIALHFYDFLDDGAPLQFTFAEETSRRIDVDGKTRAVQVMRYQADDAALEVEPESRLVLLISRGSGEFAMRLVKIT